MSRGTWTRRGSILFLLTCWVWVSACGDDEGSKKKHIGPCDVNPPALASCGQPCTFGGNPAECGDGLYCGTSSVCTADCSPDPALGFGCPNNETCTVDGRCPSISGEGSNACPSIDLNLTRPRPSVVLFIDQSYSMQWRIQDDNFPAAGERSRFSEIVAALAGDNTAGGALEPFQSSIKMNATFFTGREGAGSCPAVEQNMPVVYDNFNAIRTRLNALAASQGTNEGTANASPFDWTPTPESVGALTNGLLSTLTSTPDEPVTLVLLTDGGPDYCAARASNVPPVNQQAFEPASVDTANRLRTLAAERNIRTLVVGFGNNAAVSTGDRGPLDRQLKIMANGGAGLEPLAGLDGNTSPSADFIFATNRSSLMSAFQSLLGNQVSCTVDLQSGRITNLQRACEGKVEFNGRLLTCNPTDDSQGWRVLPDGTQIQILGSDCAALLSAPTVNLRAYDFPCGVASTLI